MAGRQGQTRHVKLGPEGIENSRTGIAEPARGLPRSRQGQDRVEAAGPILRSVPRSLRTAAGRTELIERELAAERDLFFAQPRTQQGFVPIELGHVIAEPLERPEGALPLIRLGALRRKCRLADRGARGGEPIY